MQIAFALVAIFWWIAVWGLIDLGTEDWTRTEKAQLYVGTLLVITLIYMLFPRVLQKL
jgi:hypothetical protein